MSLRVTIICLGCGREFQGKAWRKACNRERLCPACRRGTKRDFGLSHDPYDRGLDTTAHSKNEPRWLMNALMCGME